MSPTCSPPALLPRWPDCPPSWCHSWSLPLWPPLPGWPWCTLGGPPRGSCSRIEQSFLRTKAKLWAHQALPPLSLHWTWASKHCSHQLIWRSTQELHRSRRGIRIPLRPRYITSEPDGWDGFWVELWTRAISVAPVLGGGLLHNLL